MTEPTQNAEDSLATQAEAALRTFFPVGGKPEVGEPVQASTPDVPAQPAEQAAADTAPAEVVGTEQVASQSDGEDVTALKARLETAEKETETLRSRYSQTTQWAKDLALRKSTEADTSRKMLERIARGEEVSKEEVERLVAGSATAPQQPAALPYSANPFAPVQTTSDPAMAEMEAGRFFVENRIGEEDATKLVAWMQGPTSGLTQDDVVAGDTYKTLRLVYGKYEKHLNAERAKAATAVAGIARTQKAAARAASAPAGAGKASPPPPDNSVPADPQKFVDGGYFDKALSEVLSGR